MELGGKTEKHLDVALHLMKDAMDEEGIDFLHVFQNGTHRIVVDDLNDEKIGKVSAAAKTYFGKLLGEIQPSQLVIDNDLSSRPIASYIDPRKRAFTIDLASYDPAISYSDLANDYLENEARPRLEKVSPRGAQEMIDANRDGSDRQGLAPRHR